MPPIDKAAKRIDPGDIIITKTEVKTVVKTATLINIDGVDYAPDTQLKVDRQVDDPPEEGVLAPSDVSNS